jgi:DNA-binding transcriptional regulator/RsmH inhibitor MraZ
MEGTSSDWIQGKVELIIPAKFKACLGEGIITVLCAWEVFGKISCVSCNFVRNYASFDIITVGQT